MIEVRLPDDEDDRCKIHKPSQEELEDMFKEDEENNIE